MTQLQSGKLARQTDMQTVRNTWRQTHLRNDRGLSLAAGALQGGLQVSLPP